MSVQGIVIINLLGLGLIMLVFNLVRIRKLYVGYGVIWLLSIIGLMVMISFPPLLSLLPQVVGAVYPASALSLFAFIFVFLVLIFISVQLSVLSTRQVELIQWLALSELLAQEQDQQNISQDDNHEEV